MSDSSDDMEVFSGLGEFFEERNDQIDETLTLTDESLKKAVIKRGFYSSKYTELVKKILKHNTFSEKQRWCLAAYLVDGFNEEKYYDLQW